MKRQKPHVKEILIFPKKSGRRHLRKTGKYFTPKSFPKPQKKRKNDANDSTVKKRKKDSNQVFSEEKDCNDFI